MNQVLKNKSHLLLIILIFYQAGMMLLELQNDMIHKIN